MITGIHDVNLEEAIQLYSNPAKDLQLKMFNNLGQQVSANQIDDVQSGNFKIDLQNLSSGIYFLNISDGENSIVNKLIIE